MPGFTITNECVEKGDVTELHIKRAGVVTVSLIDTEDVERVKAIKWRLDPNGYVKSARFISLSRMLIGTPKGLDCDHINCNILDNRKMNLRSVTRSVNGHNRARRPRNVWWLKRARRWEVNFRQHRKYKSFGTFVSLAEAEKVAARIRAKLLAGEELTPPGRVVVGASGVRGIATTGNPSRPWRVVRYVNKRVIHLGRHATIEAAKAALKRYEETQAA